VPESINKEEREAIEKLGELSREDLRAHLK